MSGRKVDHLPSKLGVGSDLSAHFEDANGMMIKSRRMQRPRTKARYSPGHLRTRVIENKGIQAVSISSEKSCSPIVVSSQKLYLVQDRPGWYLQIVDYTPQ